MATVNKIEDEGILYDIEDTAARAQGTENADAIGNLSQLVTTDKESIVKAINSIAKTVDYTENLQLNEEIFTQDSAQIGYTKCAVRNGVCTLTMACSPIGAVSASDVIIENAPAPKHQSFFLGRATQSGEIVHFPFYVDTIGRVRISAGATLDENTRIITTITYVCA